MPCINAFGQPIGLAMPDWQPPQAPARVTLTGHWCRLEPLLPERHGADLYAANRLDPDDSSWTYLPYGPFADATSYQSWLAQNAKGDDPLFFAIIDLATGKAVGLAAYLRIEPAAGVLEVGHLKFSALLQRTPAATEAMFLLMRQAFTSGYRRYEWKCDSLNQPSRTAALRLGFSFEGIFRQARVTKGRNRDTAWFSVTDQDWPALQAAFTAWLAPDNFDAAGQQRQRLEGLRRQVSLP